MPSEKRWKPGMNSSYGEKVSKPSDKSILGLAIVHHFLPVPITTGLLRSHLYTAPRNVASGLWPDVASGGASGHAEKVEQPSNEGKNIQHSTSNAKVQTSPPANNHSSKRALF